MSERLDRVSVTTGRDDVVISLSSRDALLAEIRRLPAADSIVRAFKDAGATRPVVLTDRERATLYDLIEIWSLRVSVDELPAGVWDLRRALGDPVDKPQLQS